MAWYSDLSPCNYFGEDWADYLLAVGWLERGRQFPTGTVDSEVYNRLVEFLKDPWRPPTLGSPGGVYNCGHCLYNGNIGVRNLFVPAKKTVYVSPELITHYMNAHGYRPPEEFCQAVLQCPPMRSMEYLKAMLAIARPLAEGSRASVAPG